MATRLTPAQRLAKIDAERTALTALIAAKTDPARPAALANMLETIAKFGISRKELAAAWPRKIAFKARGPRKAKAAA